MHQSVVNNSQSDTQSNTANTPVLLYTADDHRMLRLEEDLRVLKVSICNVFHAFRSLPNTTVSTDLVESVEKGTITALVLFLGRLVERLEVYRLQDGNVEEMKGLLEDTSSMNCTLISEKEMMKREIIDIVGTCATYEEVKKKLVTMLNKSDRGEQTRSAKRQRVSVNSLCKTTKLKRVRSSQLRSRHPMYEVGSQARQSAQPVGSQVAKKGLVEERRYLGTKVERVKMSEPDDVIEVSSRDGDSDDCIKKEDLTEEKEAGSSLNGDDQETPPDSSQPDFIINPFQTPRSRKRGQYCHYDKATKLEIAQYASEHGSSKASRHYTDVLGRKVSESTVRSMLQQFAKGLLKDDDQEKDGKEGTSGQQDLIDGDKNSKSDGESSEQTSENDSPNASAVEWLPHWSTMVSETGRRKRGNYVHYDEVTRAQIGKFALQHGVASASRHFSEEIGRKVSESTIRSMRDQYQKLQQQGIVDISALPSCPRGAPTLLGNLDSKVQKWIQDVRMQGGLINTRVVMAAADGIVMKYARHKLKRFGGDITITKHYARSLLRRMGLEKPKDSKDPGKLPDDFEVIKSNFVSRVKTLVSENSVPESLIINWNHVSCPLAPGGMWTQETSVDPSTSACGLDDKRQISVILAITQSGQMLPPQVIYHGRTDRCLPSGVTFPGNWDVVFSESPLGNEETMLRYFDRIIRPYVLRVRASLGTMGHDQQAVALFDATEVNNSQALYDRLNDNNITTLFIPVCCKQQLQPIELSVNNVFKDSIKQQFIEWYSQEVLSTLIQQGTENEGTVIDMKTSRLKPIHAQWVIKTWMNLEGQTGIILQGFEKAGLLDKYSHPDECDLDPSMSSSTSSFTDSHFNPFPHSIFIDASKSGLSSDGMMNPL